MTTNQMSFLPYISILELPPSPVLQAEDPNKNLRIRIEKLEREATISRAQSAAALSQFASIPTDILEARIVNLESQLADAMDAIAKFQKVYDHQKETAQRNKKLSTIQESLGKAIVAKEDAHAYVLERHEPWLASHPGGNWNDEFNRRVYLSNDATALVTKLQDEYVAENRVVARLPPLTIVQYS